MRVGDFVPFLQSLFRSGKEHFLEGGQAVNFWAEYFTQREGPVLGLRSFVPFTSEDCDIWVSAAAQKYIEAKKEGRLTKSRSPLDGQLAILNLGGDPPKVIDLLSNVFGIDPHDYPKLFNRSLIINKVRVLDPLYLFKSKCHCVISLDQQGRQDKRHLMMLTLILPAYMQELLEEAQQGKITQRALINESKLLLGIQAEATVRRALKAIRYEGDLIPLEAYRSSELSKVCRFVDSLNGNFAP